MVLSRALKKLALTHILEQVMDQDPDSPLHKALDAAVIKSPHDICMLDYDALASLRYPASDTTFEVLPKGNVGLLHAFKSFVAHRHASGNPITDSDWLKITADEFDLFRVSPSFSTSSTIPAPATTMPARSIDLVREFKRGIKRDITHFISLKDDGAWDHWNRTTVAQARAQDVDDVLDPSFKPSGNVALELFDEKQKYMYAVFEKTLLTDKGKALVRLHQPTYDAQSIYRELKDYALQSTKAKMDASALLSYITTVKLGDGNWKGTTHAFILHWQDQVRKYHELNPLQKLPTPLQRTMLENAVHPIDELRAIKVQADQHRTQTGTDLTYSQYCDLLMSASQQYDQKLMTPMRRTPKRHVYEHDLHSETVDHNVFDIDSSISTISAYRSTFGPRLTASQWYNLTPQAQKTWDMLTPEAKSIILQPKPPPDPTSSSSKSSRLPSRSLNHHDIDHVIACLHDLCGGSQTAADNDTNTMPASNATSVHEVMQNGEEEQPILAHMTKKKSLPPGNIKRLLSPTANGQQKPPKSDQPREINVNGVTYREVNMVNYNVSAYCTTARKGALVDRGANGGIAGEDVRIIAKTGRQVDVQGIDNHQIVDIPVVTAGAVVNTQKGEVIAIMHQYAYTGKGKSIHSCGQLEAHKQVVHDKSMKIGGKQRIETLDGYIIPLNIRSGLPYMTMRPYTDKEWGELPHVILTADAEWNPSVLDCEQEDDEEWFNAMEDLPTLTADPLFDEFGDYRHIHEVTEAIMSDSIIENSVITDLPSVFQTYSNEIKPRDIDYNSYLSKFAWMPVDIVQKTFENTTQFYRMPMNTHLKKRYKSPFPACNVHRRSEPVATDTVYSDTPAIDSGVTAAQFFCGTESLVCDVYPLKSDKQFVNTLLDNIRRRGAMSKLISDRAQVEISNKVQDVLRNLMISDWQSEPHQQHQNPAERRYQDAKRLANRLMDRTGSPASLWLLALMHVCMILNFTANATIGHTVPLTKLTGITQDISPLLQFDWYEPVYYHVDENAFPSKSKEKSGRFVGISEHVGHALTYKILADDTNKIIHRSVVRTASDGLAPNQRANKPETTEPHPFIKSRIDEAPIDNDGESKISISMPIVDPEELIGRTFLVPQEDGQQFRARIVELVEDHESLTAQGSDLLKFKCSMNDDSFEEVLSYHQILEYLEKDADDPTIWKFKRIVSHQGPLDKNHKDYNGSSYNVRIEWENGEVTDEPLTVIAADDPVTCAIYARDKNLLHLPGWKRFKGIAKRQKKLFRMTNQAKLRSFRTSPKYKYGFEIPRDYDHAMLLDKRNGCDRWAKATSLEMDLMHTYLVFKDMGLNVPIPKGYKKIRVHLIYDVKHDGRHRARLVADGHLTDVPVDSVYSGVVSLRGLRLLLFIAELNGLETWATDIASAYLEAYTSEKVCICAGPEFGDLKGHILIIDKALYGLRSSGARWHDRLADSLRGEGFTPCRAEPDIWMRRNGDIYEYVAVYVDDLAFAMKDPQSFVDVLVNKCNYKVKGTGPLEFHLGADFHCDSDGTLCMAPKKYIERMIQSYEQMFGEKPHMNAYSPLEKGDHPELDDSDLLDQTGIQQYQSLIGSLQWAISLGRFDIATAVMTMSSFRAAPRQGHLLRLRRIYGYLARMKHAAIRFRTHQPDYSDLPSKVFDWASIYGDVQELLPADAPAPLGNKVTFTHYVDANLFHDALTGRSVTGIIHMVNGTPIDWYSKKQATVETATYGSEFVAARTCVEQIIDLRNTLRYLGVPINDKSYMFGDNESVVNSSTIPHAKLHKRHTALSFHRVREAIASRFIEFHFLPGEDNPADIVSKHWAYSSVWPLMQCLLFWSGDTATIDDKP